MEKMAYCKPLLRGISAGCMLGLAGLLLGCASDPAPEVQDTRYFPPIGEAVWETADPGSLGWKTEELDGLYDFLEANGTRAFLVLHNGKIVVEQYWGRDVLGNVPFGRETAWYWASAGKAITAFMVGMAQQDGHLRLDDPASAYLGEGWTSMPPAREAGISVRHQLTMSTGLSYDVPDLNCTAPACLSYAADAGTQWYYHNAPYLLLKQVVSAATGMDYRTYTQERIGRRIGMGGAWRGDGLQDVYWSTARDMARFGLLVLHEGQWAGEALLSDKAYLRDMLSPSQAMNSAYGYLWWLNGQDAIIYPGLPDRFGLPLAANAPGDLRAAMGKNGQLLDIVPSEGLVVVRMGEAPDGALVPIAFHDEMWARIGRVLGK
jgi:CubicO group peptidase (beta-lactamase class C family)